MLPFPAARADRFALPAALVDTGHAVRPLGASDLPWLRALYAESRADELAGVPWPPQMLQAFLDQQFQAQHAHYVQHYAEADFLAIERRDRRLGRLYLLRAAPDHLIVDIGLFAQARGQGLGSAVLRQIQADAAALGRGVALHVTSTNSGARRLYERLGFVEVPGGDGLYRPMRWDAPAALS
ncbi:MAG TPA: GNAT family N-acetyltransferase [Dokdonella sp.]|uniref:GNAT family N-acetyltransferase n=1 Tax=Dokdonella sp. TaxID=2291710 RepID=UPI002CA8DA73|nr:GNAT family N-acetyltransferase [Dokdonella sp.]HUD40845.1 GNAT family N-acetyltransferase [Dokdonella sp.]